MEAVEFLRKYPGEWINDADLIKVAGSEAIMSLRALRGMGIPLRARPHPNGQGLQWMLQAEEAPAPEPDRTFPIVRTPTGGYELRKLTCADCGALYVTRTEHERGPEHRGWVAERRKEAQVSVFDDIPPTEIAKPLPEGRIVFGDAKPCPRCKGKLRPERVERKTGKIIPADTTCMDPQDPRFECRTCKGVGVVKIEHGV